VTHDLLIIGGGPAGLCLAAAVSGSGLKVAVLEQQPLATLQAPAYDGREIALTHRSRRILDALGIWQRFAAEDISPLRDALVLDGNARLGLRFGLPQAAGESLGWLVPNQAIRRAAFSVAADCADVELFAGSRVIRTHRDSAAVRVGLEDGRELSGQLLVAADNRFSETRRSMGIAAELHDFARTMLVGPVRHEVAHEQVAWEWFRYGQTLALLPLHDPHSSSAVITVAPEEARRLQSLRGDALDDALSRRFDGRLGRITALGELHAYPLVGVYPRRFCGERFVLAGDAAVGMHPVTAHGFNFGLLGIESLATRIRDAAAAGQPIHSSSLLESFAREHRRATRPLYLATWLISKLYSDDRLPVRVVRKALLGFVQRLPPFRRLVQRSLTDDGGVQQSALAPQAR
jgi:ubiquinone biosynthesis UbiH/UbiF/VisC/COQ6 family hydroxylase